MVACSTGPAEEEDSSPRGFQQIDMNALVRFYLLGMPLVLIKIFWCLQALNQDCAVTLQNERGASKGDSFFLFAEPHSQRDAHSPQPRDFVLFAEPHFMGGLLISDRLCRFLQSPQPRGFVPFCGCGLRNKGQKGTRVNGTRPIEFGSSKCVGAPRSCQDLVPSYDAIEYFCGTKSITKGAAQQGFRSFGFDLEHDEAPGSGE